MNSLTSLHLYIVSKYISQLTTWTKMHKVMKIYKYHVHPEFFFLICNLPHASNDLVNFVNERVFILWQWSTGSDVLNYNTHPFFFPWMRYLSLSKEGLWSLFSLTTFTSRKLSLAMKLLQIEWGYIDLRGFTIMNFYNVWGFWFLYNPYLNLGWCLSGREIGKGMFLFPCPIISIRWIHIREVLGSNWHHKTNASLCTYFIRFQYAPASWDTIWNLCGWASKVFIWWSRQLLISVNTQDLMWMYIW